jgi:hypothetical protein
VTGINTWYRIISTSFGVFLLDTPWKVEREVGGLEAKFSYRFSSESLKNIHFSLRFKLQIPIQYTNSPSVSFSVLGAPCIGRQRLI